MRFTKRVNNIKPSPTLEMTARVAVMKAEGIDVIGFGAGEPDFDTPDNIKKAAIEALAKGFTKYTPVSGIDPLKDAIIAKLKRDNGLTCGRKEIIVSCGAKHALYNVAMSLFEEEDEVIIPAPYWVSYFDIVSLANAKPVIVKTLETDGFLLSAESFARAVTPKTRALILNYPNNPTGATYTRKQLEEITSIAVDNNILIISDEVYEKIIYTDYPHVSVASLGDKVRELTIYVNSLSKTFSMTGWRIGYTMASEEIIKAMTKVQSQSTSNPTSIAQYAGIEALNGPQAVVAERRDDFRVRRDFVVERLGSIDGITCRNPSGAFYVFPDFSHYYGKKFKGLKIKGSLQMTEYLINEAKVALIPGVVFGNDFCVRLSYASSIDNLKKGLNRIEEALGKLE